MNGEQRFLVAARVASAVVTLLGTMSLLGWIFHVPILTSILPGFVTMKVNTAVSFVLAGAALSLRIEPTAPRWRTSVGVGCSLVVVAVGLLTTIEYAFGLDLGIDQILLRAPVQELHTSSPGRMAPVTALSFTFVGIALVLLDAKNPGLQSLQQVLALGALLAGFLATTGYVLSVRPLYGVAGYTSMALHTAVAFLVLATGIWLARPRRGLVAILAQDNPAGAAVRRLLPAIVVFPLVAAWIRLKGQQAGYYDTEFGLALMVAFCTAVIGSLALWNARAQGVWERERADAMSALRTSEERFRALVDASAQIVWSTAGNGEVVEDSPTWRAFTGQSFEQWRGWGRHDVLHPDDRERTVAIWNAALRARTPIETEYRLRHKSGDWRSTVVRAVPLFNADATVREWVGMNIDITDRRAAEEANKANERLQERLRERGRFFELSLDMVCIASTEGRFLEVNPEFSRVLGYSTEELLAKPFLDFVHPDDLASTLREVEKLDGGRPTLAFTNRYRRNDGQYRWLQWRSTPDESGTLYAIARDVTDDMQKAQTLLESEERLRLLVEGARDYAIFMIDLKGRVGSWNAGAERLYGYRADEVVGRHFSMFYPEEHGDAKHSHEECARALADGRCEEEGWRVRKDGSLFWANAVLSTVRDKDGTPSGFAKVVRDFSERQRAKQELEAREASLAASLKEREVLLQEVHHRVKNNLQVIASLVNMQIRQVADPSTRGALTECQTRIQAIALIHEKLYQSKDYARIPFSEYARSLAGNIFHATGVSPASVTLALNIETLALTVDKAIPCGLILNELITNALKHAFPNQRRGSIRVDLRPLAGGEVVLSVADDGVGLSASFDVEKSSSLGMQLVTTLVEQIDGRLEILRPSGTTFTVTFPAEAPA